jgi:hypothetical protein
VAVRADLRVDEKPIEDAKALGQSGAISAARASTSSAAGKSRRSLTRVSDNIGARVP